ncbi:MAG TPA: ankyrin repeat domain-containing protein [Burkholderiales bacterium]|nr:ankyrin repeat domain-containing protein [Burkholderiales bacterium]
MKQAKRLAVVLCAAWGIEPSAQTGLEFLEPQEIAFVQVRGVVRDEASGGPIAGANVLAIWEGTTYGFHSSNRLCLRVDAARTGADGAFSLVTPSKNVYRKGMSQQYVDIRIHAPGMQERFEAGTDSRKMKTIQDQQSTLAKLTPPREYGLELAVHMFPMKEDTPDRLRTLQHLARQPLRCETTGDAHKVQAYFEAQATEARTIAKTRYQVAVAQSLKSDADMTFSDFTQRQEASFRIMEAAYRNPEASDLERRDSGSLTPVMKAASDGNANAVRALLEAGASPNRTVAANDLTSGDSALTLAMSKYLLFRVNKQTAQASRYTETIQALLADSKTNVNMRERPYSLTPLMKALYHSQEDVVEWLLAAGADPNVTAYQGAYTALGIALNAMNQTRDGKPLPEATRQLDLLLATKGINLDLIIRDGGGTPLTQSLVYGNAGLAKRLLEAGANPNALDRMKRTAITASVSAAVLNPQHPRFLDGVRLVAEWPGVDFGARYEGKTALQMARSARRDDLVAILERRP